MYQSTGKISICCVKVDAKYTLQFQGVDWSETVPSLEAAIRRAGELIVEETEVTVYDATGVGVVVTTLFPIGTTPSGGSLWADRLLTAKPEEGSLGALKTVLATKGVRGAVKYLNSLTSHRFTSLYRFDGPTLRRVTFYDRENPDNEDCEDIPVEASYCVFVRDSGRPFSIQDAASDDRVKDHPKREVVKRYCGVPLLDDAGRMFGTICHFDFSPGRIDEAEVALLERMAEILRPSAGELTPRP
jgi:hypothetical protein